MQKIFLLIGVNCSLKVSNSGRKKLSTLPIPGIETVMPSEAPMRHENVGLGLYSGKIISLNYETGNQRRSVSGGFRTWIAARVPPTFFPRTQIRLKSSAF